jgi:hypothetical protein
MEQILGDGRAELNRDDSRDHQPDGGNPVLQPHCATLPDAPEDPRSREAALRRARQQSAAFRRMRPKGVEDLLVVGGFSALVEAFDNAPELHRRHIRGCRTWCSGEGERVL